MCLFPTSFTTLSVIAWICSVALIASTLLLLWRVRFQGTSKDALLMGTSLLVAIGAGVLAFVSRQHQLICAGPNASASLIQQSQNAANTLLLFECLVIVTLLVSVALVLLCIVRYQQPRPHEVAQR